LVAGSPAEDPDLTREENQTWRLGANKPQRVLPWHFSRASHPFRGLGRKHKHYEKFRAESFELRVRRVPKTETLRGIKDNLKLAPDAKIDFSKSNLKLYCSSADQQVIGQVISLK
jgi:hypothetical protein